MYEQQIKQVAERLHGLRDSLDLSIDDFASKLGIDTDKYSNYEQGNSDIPMSLIYSVAKVFNVEIQAIISGDNAKEVTYSIVRKGKGVIVKRKSENCYQSLVGNYKNASGSPFLVTAQPQPENAPISLNTHDSDELDLVLEGSLLIQVDGNVERLEAGDSIYFNARHQHGVKAVGNSEVKFLSIAL